MGKKKGSYEIALQALNSPNLRSTTAVGSTLRVGEQPGVKTETIQQQVKKSVKKIVKAAKQNRKENINLWDTIIDPTTPKAAKEAAFDEWADRFTQQALPTAISGISNGALKNVSLAGMTEVPQAPTQGLASPPKQIGYTHKLQPYMSEDDIVGDIISGLIKRNERIVPTISSHRHIPLGKEFMPAGGMNISTEGRGLYGSLADRGVLQTRISINPARPRVRGVGPFPAKVIPSHFADPYEYMSASLGENSGVDMPTIVRNGFKLKNKNDTSPLHYAFANRKSGEFRYPNSNRSITTIGPPESDLNLVVLGKNTFPGHMEVGNASVDRTSASVAASARNLLRDNPVSDKIQGAVEYLKATRPDAYNDAISASSDADLFVASRPESTIGAGRVTYDFGMNNWHDLQGFYDSSIDKLRKLTAGEALHKTPFSYTRNNWPASMIGGSSRSHVLSDKIIKKLLDSEAVLWDKDEILRHAFENWRISD